MSGIGFARLATILGLVAHGLMLLVGLVSSRPEQFDPGGSLLSLSEEPVEQHEYASVLAWVATRVPETAAILIVARPSLDNLWYYRASYELVPRRVWLAREHSAEPGIDWGVESPADREAWRETIRRHEISYLLVVGLSPGDLTATGLDRIAWTERYSTAYLIALERTEER